jgi:hypothetical protein
VEARGETRGQGISERHYAKGRLEMDSAGVALAARPLVTHPGRRGSQANNLIIIFWIIFWIILNRFMREPQKGFVSFEGAVSTLAHKPPRSRPDWETEDYGVAKLRGSLIREFAFVKAAGASHASWLIHTAK